jgi:hypothetical protein
MQDRFPRDCMLGSDVWQLQMKLWCDTQECSKRMQGGWIILGSVEWQLQMKLQCDTQKLVRILLPEGHFSCIITGKIAAIAEIIDHNRACASQFDLCYH